MSNDVAGPDGSELSEGLGPLLAEADMDALAAVAHEAGLSGIDLRALARVLDAAQRIAVAAERERIRATIADDAYAATFQSLGQYRSALLRAFWRA